MTHYARLVCREREYSDLCMNTRAVMRRLLISV